MIYTKLNLDIMYYLFRRFKTSHNLQGISLGIVGTYYFTFVRVCLNPMTFSQLIPLWIGPLTHKKIEDTHTHTHTHTHTKGTKLDTNTKDNERHINTPWPLHNVTFWKWKHEDLKKTNLTQIWKLQLENKITPHTPWPLYTRFFLWKWKHKTWFSLHNTKEFLSHSLLWPITLAQCSLPKNKDMVKLFFVVIPQKLIFSQQPLVK